MISSGTLTSTECLSPKVRIFRSDLEVSLVSLSVKEYPESYDKHIEYVKRVVPKEKLHFVKLSDGWDPFCRILGKPVPKEPLPRANDAEDAERIFKTVALQAALVWLGIFTVIGIGVYTGLSILRG